MRVVVLFLAGCAQIPLLDVPIVGGTEAQRAAAREEIASFDAAIGTGRLTGLRDITFETLPSMEISGMARRHRVWLDPALSADEVPGTLRHELCHVLDFVEGLSEQRPELFDAFAEGLFDPDIGDIPARLIPESINQRMEAFAQFCDLGALSAAMLSVPCEGETGIAADATSFIAHSVWSSFEMNEVALQPRPIVSFQNDWTPDMLSFDATRQPDVLHAEFIQLVPGTFYAQEQRTAYLNLYTGEEVLGETAVPDAPIPDGLPAELYLTSSSGSENLAAALGFVALHHLGYSVPRRLVWVEDAWAIAEDRCTWPAEDLFTVDERVFHAWAEGPVASWAEIAPQ